MGDFDGHHAVETLMQDGAPDPVALRRYFDRAMQNQNDSELAATLNHLQMHFPGDHNVQKLIIAHCLAQQDYPAAMAEIETLISKCTPDDDLVDAALAVRHKIGPMSIADCPPDRPTVSLCMIVKDEAKGLGACLHVAKKLVDEIIVVDTGSKDRSRDIASIYGASTISYAWDNNFSAARNVSLSHARGDWILVLDADEIIASPDHGVLHKLLLETNPGTTAYSIETRNYSYVANLYGWQANDGSYPQHEAGLGWVPSRKIRLFPRRSDVQFCFPVHERVEPTIRSAGIEIVDCAIPVHHYGDLNQDKKLQKAETYFQMGLTKLDQLKNDRPAIRELAVQAGELQRWAESIELWQRLLELQPNYVEAYVNISGALWQLGRYRDALDSALQAANLDPNVKESWFNIAVSHLMLGRAKKAAGLLEALTRKQPAYLSAQFMLAAAYACLGEPKRSQELFERLRASGGGGSIYYAMQDLIERIERDQPNSFAKRLNIIAQQFAPENE
jgi:glycosyltransferase involved in cell wall biosynthesis